LGLVGWLLGGLAAAAGWLALRSFSPAGDGHSICLMRDIAHVACPLRHDAGARAPGAGPVGRLARAHPLAAPLAAQGAAAWILWVTGSRVARGGSPTAGSPASSAADAAALLALWVIRLATGTLPG